MVDFSLPELLNVHLLALVPRGVLIYIDFPLWIFTLLFGYGYVVIIMHKKEWDSLGDKPFLYGNYLIMVQ